MSSELQAKVRALPEDAWQPYRSLNPRAELHEERQCARLRAELEAQPQEGGNAPSLHRHPGPRAPTGSL